MAAEGQNQKRQERQSKNDTVESRCEPEHPREPEDGEVKQDKELLPYKDGKLGFRHSTNLDI